MKNYKPNEIYYLPVLTSESTHADDRVVIKFETGNDLQGLGYDKLIIKDAPRLLLTREEVAEFCNIKNSKIPSIQTEEIPIMEGKYHQNIGKCGTCGHMYSIAIYDDEKQEVIGKATILRNNEYPDYCPYCGGKLFK